MTGARQFFFQNFENIKFLTNKNQRFVSDLQT
jgi:hypothetical protein